MNNVGTNLYRISTQQNNNRKKQHESTTGIRSVLHPDSLEGVGVGDALLVLANVGFVIHPNEAVWTNKILVSVTGGWTLAMEGALNKEQG